MEKVYITGTGRCGTTFLIKLFSFLNFNTGFNKSNYAKDIFSHCNSGMENAYNSVYDVVKNPTIIHNIKTIVADPKVHITAVIIPIRDYKASAASRIKHGRRAGGLWNATDEASQISFYNTLISNYIYYMTKYEINTIFLDFDKMISDKTYLYDKLKPVLDTKNIDFETFSVEYDEATRTSRRNI